MKNAILTLFGVAVLFASCSKERKLNKRLDGEWNVTMVDGNAVNSPMSFVLKFEKDKKGKGKMTSTFFDGTTTEVENYNYELDEDNKLYTFETSGAASDTLNVAEYSKTKLKLIGTDNYVIEATKK